MNKKLQADINRLTQIVTEEESYIDKVPGKIIGSEQVYWSGRGYGVEGYYDKPIYEYKNVKKTRPKFSDDERTKAKKELIEIYNNNREARRDMLEMGGVSRMDIFDHNHPTLADLRTCGSLTLGCATAIAFWGGVGYGSYRLISYLFQLSD